MAGEYTKITKDYISENGDRFYAHHNPLVDMPVARKAQIVFIGRTHGCSCCSTEEVISMESMKKHIESLEKELKIAKKIYEIMQGK